MIKSIFLSFVFFLFSSLSFGDIVTLKDGRSFEGKIIKQNKKTIVIWIKKGTFCAKIPLKRSSIASIQKQVKTTWDRLRESYLKKKKKLYDNPSITGWDDLAKWSKKIKFYQEEENAWKESLALRVQLAAKVNTPTVWFRLAQWCKGKKFYKKEQDLYQKVIRLDLNHLQARKALGFKQYKKTWVSEKVYLEKIEEDMRLKGFVKYKGKWYQARALESLLRIKKLEQDKAVKELKANYEKLSRKTVTMEKNMAQMLKRMKNLQDKITAQNRALENRNRYFLNYGTGYYYPRYRYYGPYYPYSYKQHSQQYYKQYFQHYLKGHKPQQHK